MNYLIVRKSESEIRNFIKEYPYSYATQIAEFLKADANYIRVLIREYKQKNGIKESNIVDSKKFILYLKRRNNCKSIANQL